MKQWGRKAIGLLLAAIMLFSMVPAVFADAAASFSDFPTGWSNAAMTAAVNNGLLTGYEDGSIRPQGKLTRAEFAAIITRAFGAVTKTDISGYTDVAANAWYYDAIAKAVKMGALKGQSATRMAPDANITRQEVFTALARVLVLASDDTSALNKFGDKAAIASWATPSMAALAARGYVNGDDKGNANPEANITREEFAQLMHNAIRTYIAAPGTYTADLDGITVIRVGDVTLKGLSVTSDLVVGDGAMKGDIRIEDVTIEKRLLARGGTIKVVDSTSGEPVVVNNVNGVTNFKNYRDEAFFKNIVENTVAKFLDRKDGSGSRPVIEDDDFEITLKIEGHPDVIIEVIDGEIHVTIPTPSKPYYTFDGWFTAGGEEVAVEDFVDLGEDTVLHAQFTPITYTLAYDFTEGGTWEAGYTAPTSFTVESEGSLPTRVVAPANKELDGWKWNAIGFDTYEEMIAALITAGALPEYTTGTITIAPNYNTVGTPDVVYTVTLKVDGADYDTITVTNGVADLTGYVEPTKANHTFLGWFTAATGGTKVEITDFGTLGADTTLYAQFEEITIPDVVYTVTLKVDGADYDTITVTNGVADMTGYVEPTKANHTFLGWFTAATGGTKVETSAFGTLGADTTLYAQFEEITIPDVVYTVTLKVDGADYDTITVTNGVADMTGYVEPTKANHTFLGWFTAATGGTKVETSAFGTLGADTTLYAQFEEITIPDVVYTVTLMKDGAVYDTITVTNGVADMTGYVDPTKDYYNFSGWFTAIYYGTKVEVSDFGTLGADTTLHAKFDPIVYTLAYDLLGGSWEDGYTTYPTTFTINSWGDLPNRVVAPAGQEFRCWTYALAGFTAFESMISTVKLAGDLPVDRTTTITIKASYRTATTPDVVYDVTLMKDGAVYDTITVTNGVADMTGYVEPTKANHTFLGWFTAATGGTKVETSAFGTLGADTTLYAQFEEITVPDVVYTVTLKVDGADYDTITVTNGVADMTGYVEPTKANHTFLGWFTAATGGTKVETSAFGTLGADTTLYAQFEEITVPDVVYTVTLKVDGADYDTITVTNGVADLTGYVEPTKANHTFLGWFTAATGGTKVETSAFGTLGADTTLYAQFEEITIPDVVYTVTLKVDGADYDTITVTNGVADLTGYVEPTKANHTFLGWFTAATGGTKVETSAFGTLGADTTLYAQFEEITIPDVVYTVTLKVDGADYDTITVTNGVADMTGYVEPTKANHTFLGWFTAATGGTKVETSAFGTLGADTTLYAQFEEITVPDVVVTITFMVGTTQYDKIVITNGVPDKTTVTDPTKAFCSFVGWFDASDNQVTDYLSATSDLTLYAKFVADIYYVEYVATFVTGFTPDGDYTIDDVASYVLPAADKVVAPAGYEFKYWKNRDTGVRVDALSITDATPTTLYLEPHFELIPAEPVTVTFYRIYSTLPPFVIGTPLSVEKGSTVDAAAFPDATLYNRKGYEENGVIASVYEGDDYVHTITPEFWYVNASGDMVPFDETVVINEDTNVFLLTKSLSLFLTYEYAGKEQALSVSADYNDETRVMNSIKDIIAKSGRNQLELALDTDMIPKYDEAVAKALDKLVEFGVLKLDGDKKNIQIVDVPIKISLLVKEATIHQMVRDYLRMAVNDPVMFTDVYHHLDMRGNAGDLGIDHIINGMTDDEVKAFVSGLNANDKKTLADKLFEVISAEADYLKLVDSLLHKDSFEVNKLNVSEIVILKKSIRELSLEDALADTHNDAIIKLVDKIGIDKIRPYYEEMRNKYCDGLEVIVEDVMNSSDPNFKENYTTSLTYELNIFAVYEKLYEKAADKVINKLENAGIYYNENEYLKFLVEQDFLSYLVDGDKSLASGDFTGYSLKGVMDYYDYLTMLLIVGDDALTWYGDTDEGLSEAQFEALYDAMFDKVFIAHEKMNDILETFVESGTLPSKVQKAIESIDRVNKLFLQYSDKAKTLIKKYLGSTINAKFEDESIADDERVIKLIDVIIGNDDPTFTIDTLYTLLYKFDAKLQPKLQQLVESDKFQKAIDKFEATSFGELFDGKGKLGTIGDKMDELKNNGRIQSAMDSIYDVFYIIAHEGIDAFKVPEAELDVTDIDAYEVKIAKVTLRVERAYR